MAALALGRFPLNVSSRGGYFEIVKAITEDAVPALPPQIFSEEFRGFVEHMLRRQASERPSAADLLVHPFLRKHQDCFKLVNMVKVAPASPAEVCTTPASRLFPPCSPPSRYATTPSILKLKVATVRTPRSPKKIIPPSPKKKDRFRCPWASFVSLCVVLSNYGTQNTECPHHVVLFFAFSS